MLKLPGAAVSGNSELVTVQPSSKHVYEPTIMSVLYEVSARLPLLSKVFLTCAPCHPRFPSPMPPKIVVEDLSGYVLDANDC